MIGVRFTRAMTPYAAGDTALLPDHEAQRMIGAGEAVAHTFPDQPFANDALTAQSAAPAYEPAKRQYRRRDQA